MTKKITLTDEQRARYKEKYKPHGISELSDQELKAVSLRVNEEYKEYCEINKNWREKYRTKNWRKLQQN
jgi:DNA repair protein RadC